jgi:hypothetical protein
MLGLSEDVYAGIETRIHRAGYDPKKVFQSRLFISRFEQAAHEAEYLSSVFI